MTTTVTNPTRWDALRCGDVILCPVTGKPEEVLRSRRHEASPMWFVRTEHHDHIRDPAERVTVTERA